jgi:peptidoglycan/LPS O-acetylase OafA/YrhL
VAGGLASPLGLAIIIFFVLFSTGHIIDQKAVYSQQYFSYYGFLAGFLIFCILYAKGRILDKFLTLAPLRELGTVGLSLYLVHPMVKNLIDSFCSMYFGYKLKNFSLLLATLGCSYLLSRYTFKHIEQPGFLEKAAKNSAVILNRPGH